MTHKMSTLLAWPGENFLPLYSTGAKAVPAARITTEGTPMLVAIVACQACCNTLHVHLGCHAHLMQRYICLCSSCMRSQRHSASMMSWSKAGPAPASPIRACGLTCFTTSSNSYMHQDTKVHVELPLPLGLHIYLCKMCSRSHTTLHVLHISAMLRLSPSCLACRLCA